MRVNQLSAIRPLPSAKHEADILYVRNIDLSIIHAVGHYEDSEPFEEVEAISRSYYCSSERSESKPQQFAPSPQPNVRVKYYINEMFAVNNSTLRTCSALRYLVLLHRPNNLRQFGEPQGFG